MGADGKTLDVVVAVAGARDWGRVVDRGWKLGIGRSFAVWWFGNWVRFVRFRGCGLGFGAGLRRAEARRRGRSPGPTRDWVRFVSFVDGGLGWMEQVEFAGAEEGFEGASEGAGGRGLETVDPFAGVTGR